MHKIVSITLFSFLILFLILVGFFSSKKTEGEVLRTVDLQGCNLLSKSEYLIFANINTERDLRKYSLSSLRERFLQHPYVGNASVLIDVDKKVYITIEEKSFEAVALLHKQVCLISSQNEIIPILPNTEVLDFPVLTNLSENSVEKENERNRDVQRAFTIIRSARKMSDNLSQSISEINLHNGGDITLSLLHGTSVIFLGKKNLTEKIYTLDALIKQIGNRISLANTNYIDLRYAGNIFIGTDENAGI